jgi:hypothetical protein
MAESGLSGPFALTTQGVQAAVPSTSPGAYALGKTNDKGAFVIHYVGRADADLRARLLGHVKAWYPQFKASYFGSAKAAFEKECQLFHSFGETALDNKIHPARPEGSNWKCLRCKNFG